MRGRYFADRIVSSSLRSRRSGDAALRARLARDAGATPARLGRHRLPGRLRRLGGLYRASRPTTSSVGRAEGAGSRSYDGRTRVLAWRASRARPDAGFPPAFFLSAMTAQYRRRLRRSGKPSPLLRGLRAGASGRDGPGCGRPADLGQELADLPLDLQLQDAQLGLLERGEHRVDRFRVLPYAGRPARPPAPSAPSGGGDLGLGGRSPTPERGASGAAGAFRDCANSRRSFRSFLTWGSAFTNCSSVRPRLSWRLLTM